METRIKSLFKKVVRERRLLFAKSSWHRKALNLQHDFPGELVKDPAGVFLPNMQIHIPHYSFEFLLDGYRHLRDISLKPGTKFYFEDDSFMIEIYGKKLNVTTAEELLIIVEIFVIGSYNFSGLPPLIMIDVGMNVGFASLFFASNPNISKIYSFEPFLRTYHQAIKNLNLNKRLAEKISCFNYGLSDETVTLSLDYNYDNKGQVGIYGTTLIKSEVKSVNSAVVTFRNVSGEFVNILNNHPDGVFAMKVDCEGSEYAILRNLSENHLLKKIRVVFIEWHEKGPEELLAFLTDSGFTAFYQQSRDKKVGMIYAVC